MMMMMMTPRLPAIFSQRIFDFRVRRIGTDRNRLTILNGGVSGIIPSFRLPALARSLAESVRHLSFVQLSSYTKLIHLQDYLICVREREIEIENRAQIKQNYSQETKERKVFFFRGNLC